MKIRTFLTVSLSGLFLFACHKKDTTVSRSELLTSGSWKLSAAVSDNDGNGTYETDDYAGFPSCAKDDIYTFKSNGKFSIDEGPTKCDPGDPQIDEIDWQLTDSDKTLLIDSDPYSIVQLDNQTFKIKEDLGAGQSSLVTFTKR
jgi:hypothetical protein